MENFAFVSMNERKHGIAQRNGTLLSLDEELSYQKLARQILNADSAVYDHFKQKLLREIDELGTDYMEKHLKQLRDAITFYQKTCGFRESFVQNKNHVMDLLNAPRSESSNLSSENESLCAEFVRWDTQWSHLISNRNKETELFLHF